MAMGSEDVGRLQLGRDVLGNEKIIQLARDLTLFGAAGVGHQGSKRKKGGWTDGYQCCWQGHRQCWQKDRMMLRCMVSQA